MQNSNQKFNKVLLLILDGFGIGKKVEHNAIYKAKSPNLDKLIFHNHLSTFIEASGIAVGLPEGVMGNSEVGHINIGAGRSIEQDLIRINKSIENDSLKNNLHFNEFKDSSNRLHIMGLFSDGGVHSHLNHLKYILKYLSSFKSKEIYLHLITDGRDTAPQCCLQYFNDLNVNQYKNIKIASVAGRYYTMDRDQRWERIQKSYDCYTSNKNIYQGSVENYVNENYNRNITDEFFLPQMFCDSGNIQENDSILFINFRPDRARQIALSFTKKDFSFFTTPVKVKNYFCMTPYFEADEIKLPVLMNKEKIYGGLSEIISKKGLKQLKIAETEKYAHVTYFFNGGIETPFENEERILISSPKEVETYDQKPAMSLLEIKNKLIEKLKDPTLSLYVANFANPDMVGHTGNFEATKSAIEFIDECLGEILEVCHQNNISLILTADHGNADCMVDKKGNPHTAHTTSLVPFSVLLNTESKCEFKLNTTLNNNKMALKNIAASVLAIMGVDIPKSYHPPIVCPLIT